MHDNMHTCTKLALVARVVAYTLSIMQDYAPFSGVFGILHATKKFMMEPNKWLSCQYRTHHCYSLCRSMTDMVLRMQFVQMAPCSLPSGLWVWERSDFSRGRREVFLETTLPTFPRAVDICQLMVSAILIILWVAHSVLITITEGNAQCFQGFASTLTSPSPPPPLLWTLIFDVASLIWILLLTIALSLKLSLSVVVNCLVMIMPANLKVTRLHQCH